MLISISRSRVFTHSRHNFHLRHSPRDLSKHEEVMCNNSCHRLHFVKDLFHIDDIHDCKYFLGLSGLIP